MDEESGEPHSDGKKVPPEKTRKRKLKTPFQVEALENFFNEHKYPTEAKKLELAETIGLTEKQVSGWFCHRRLKDKRLLREEACGNGKQDRSSGVIQDRGSGLRQDSCGSTKQGDDELLDPREVESRSFYGEESTPAGHNYERRRHYSSGNMSVTDDSSSETSSPSHDAFLHHSGNPSDMDAKKYLPRHLTTVSATASGVRYRGNARPSGYLKVKMSVEDAAIAAVKQQLGRYYCEDGPPLDVKFQPLPPGAFGSPDTMHVNAELCRSNDSTQQKSSSVFGAQKQSNFNMRYERPHSRLTSPVTHMGGGDIDAIDGLDPRDDYSSQRSKPKSTLLNYSNPSAGGSYSTDRNEDLAGETSSYNTSRNHQKRPKHVTEETRSDFISGHKNYLCNGNLPGKPMEPWIDSSGDSPEKFIEREGFNSKTANTKKFLDAEESEPSRRISKGEKLYGKVRAVKEHQGSVPRSACDVQLAGRVRDEFPSHDLGMKAPFMEIPRQANRVKGSAMEIPSSLSEDETAETSLSMD